MRKYKNADREWIWQFVFPSNRIFQDPRSKSIRRHDLHESGLQKGFNYNELNDFATDSS